VLRVGPEFASSCADPHVALAMSFPLQASVSLMKTVMTITVSVLGVIVRIN
jgi:hypothetical protein